MRMRLTDYKEYSEALSLNIKNLDINSDGFVYFSRENFPEICILPVELFENLPNLIDGFGTCLSQVQYAGDHVRFPREAISINYQQKVPSIDFANAKIDENYFALKPSDQSSKPPSDQSPQLNDRFQALSARLGLETLKMQAELIATKANPVLFGARSSVRSESPSNLTPKEPIAPTRATISPIS